VDYATVKFSQSTIKIKPGQSAKVTLKFTEPKNGKAADWPLYSGFVVATPRTKGGVAVHIPYTGVKGDIRNVPIQDTSLGFPALQMVNSTGQLNDVPKGFTFDLKDNKPVVLSRFGSHSPDATIRIFDSNKKFVGFLTSTDGGAAFGATGRMTNVDSTTGQLVFAQYTWEGQVLAAENATLAPTTLAAGSYDIVVASQKKLTKGNYPGDFEIFDLGTVKIA
ncbi:hypothetical protein BGZ54_003181, partial [Gamsiella multidivaricata]